MPVSSMMNVLSELILFIGIAAVTAYPTEDIVISKLDEGGPRYQYMAGHNGSELVDLWLKKTDLEEIARYNPAQHINYHLFTRNNPSISQPLLLGSEQTLSSSNYDRNKKTVILIHGWRNTPTSDFNVYLTAAYLRAEDVNLIMVDWSVGAAGLYVVAMRNSITSAYPTEDIVISKLDEGGPRYQYMAGHNGSELVDLWLKKTDLEEIARYNPAQHINYHLFTRNNPSISQPLLLGSEQTLSSSNYDRNKKTVILIHGWRNTPTSDFNVYLTAAYLRAEDVNLIMVDWSVGAAGLYVVAMRNSITSGEHVANFITWLIEASGADINDFHIIGHSLGAHQAGIVGRHLGGRLPYITGLDPAMPGWISNSAAISSDVAIYTEIMHTNGGISDIVRPAGHVDFYPNGGLRMPGCENYNCSHHKTIFYMVESLIWGGFTGRRCDSLAGALSGNCDLDETLPMGGRIPKTGRSGIFFLTTNADSPYSQG